MTKYHSFSKINFKMIYLPKAGAELLLASINNGKLGIPALLSLQVPPLGDCTLGGRGGGGD